MTFPLKTWDILILMLLDKKGQGKDHRQKLVPQEG
jgi:hypothetical protein